MINRSICQRMGILGFVVTVASMSCTDSGSQHSASTDSMRDTVTEAQNESDTVKSSDADSGGQDTTSGAETESETGGMSTDVEHGSESEKDTSATVDSDSTDSQGGESSDNPTDVSQGTDSDDTGIEPPSAEFLRIKAELEKADRGEPADLDGDGVIDFMRVIYEDGTMSLEVDRNGDGYLEAWKYQEADFSWSQGNDGDEDGLPESETTFVPGPPMVLTRTADVNLDGAYDTRTTMTFDTAARTIHVVEEQDAMQDGNFAVTNEYDRPMAQDACYDANNKCTPTAAGCVPPGGSREPSDNAHIEIDHSGDPTADTGGRCSTTHVNQIKKAIRCAVERNEKCLKDTNSKLANDLADALSGGQCNLVISCANPCTPATTDVNPQWTTVLGCNDIPMNIDPANWDSMTNDDDRCNLMLHEMLHWAGEGGASDHDNGKDSIYACGRYCANCSNWGMGGPSSPNVDCARCADTAEGKKKCGIKQTYEAGECSWGAGLGLCHAGLGCILGSCESCKYVYTKTCDGADVLMETFNCCAACPSDCNSSNDMPCSAVQPWLDDTCSKKPPMCP